MCSRLYIYGARERFGLYNPKESDLALFYSLYILALTQFLFLKSQLHIAIYMH